MTRRLRSIPVLVASLALSLAACGDEASVTEAETRAEALDPRLVPGLTQGAGGPVREARIGFSSARRICSSADLELLAEAYGTKPDARAVADAMAVRLDTTEEIRNAVRSGCLEGLPAAAACIESWNAPENAEMRVGTAAEAGREIVYVVGATHTPALDAVDACVLVFTSSEANPFGPERWQPDAIRVRAGGRWGGASSLLGNVTSPTAIAVGGVPGVAQVVVVLPLQPAATMDEGGVLAPVGEP